MEDSFGFSWNFPPEANSFPYAGYHPFFGGYAAYRFFLNDRIPFRKSLRMSIAPAKPRPISGKIYPNREANSNSPASLIGIKKSRTGPSSQRLPQRSGPRTASIWRPENHLY